MVNPKLEACHQWTTHNMKFSVNGYAQGNHHIHAYGICFTILKSSEVATKQDMEFFYNTYEKNKSEEIVKPKAFVGLMNSQQQRTYNA